MSVEVISFGCRLNLAEGEALREAFADEDDLIVINSCAVTAEAERQARQAIRRAARARPEAQIIVTGCAAETSGSAFTAMPEVSGTYSKITKIVTRAKAGVPLVLDTVASGTVEPRVEHGMTGYGEPAISGADHARAFIEVQNGCDHDCTFCIIPLGRGRSRSHPVDAVVRAVEQAVSRGQQEVILTGVDLTSWGHDLTGAPPLGHLVEAILKRVPALPRLRLSSLDSIEIDPLLEELLTGDARMMPHIHLSLQHGDDLILKRMKRRHSRAQAVALVERLKAKRDITIGADIIAGFPTESEAAFANSLSLLDDCDIVLAHIFPYSPRPNTAAARMPQLDRATVKSRAARLRTHASERKAKWLASLVGTIQPALIELDGQAGHLDNFASVRLEAPLRTGNMRGTMTNLLITASDGEALTGVPA